MDGEPGKLQARESDQREFLNRAGFEQSIRLVLDQKFPQAEVLLRIGDDDIAHGFFETGGVSHQVAQRNGLRAADGEVEIPAHIDIEVDQVNSFDMEASRNIVDSGSTNRAVLRSLKP